MDWDKGLLPEQRDAAKHLGCHCRLLAGPGTGKTLTLSRRIAYLVCKQGIDPSSILALTFTRAAAYQLRQQVTTDLEKFNKPLPYISTLHSFALRQLLRNSEVTRLPKPVRIADDWEEKHIIQEDIKEMLGLSKIKEAYQKFADLSADWETLARDNLGWEQSYRDPQFLGAWTGHRDIYGYTLRSELVYQLKKALEQEPNFQLEQPFTHILVDEYQDLNKCDLTIVKHMTGKGAELFCAGDDDQSIYGFRYAHPEGIRQFDKEYNPHNLKTLKYCIRCDRKIIELGEFVAKLDYKRLPGKDVLPMPKAKDGEVEILYFDNETQESEALAEICHHLINVRGATPSSILILLRSDLYGAYSTPIRDYLQRRNIPVSNRALLPPTDEKFGRLLLALLRLCFNRGDHLAWRTLLQERKNQIGPTKIKKIYETAKDKGIPFSEAIKQISDSSDFPGISEALKNERNEISMIVNDTKNSLGSGIPLDRVISELADKVITDPILRKSTVDYLTEIARESGNNNLEDFLTSLSAASENFNQEIEEGKVNILTMHRAKGLTADTVFLAAAENERIPGIQVGEKAQDERRLLYVSLTRAKHSLFVTYCVERRGLQGHQGGRSRHLTGFLQNASIKPKPGSDYLRSMGSNIPF